MHCYVYFLSQVYLVIAQALTNFGKEFVAFWVGWSVDVLQFLIFITIKKNTFIAILLIYL